MTYDPRAYITWFQQRFQHDGRDPRGTIQMLVEALLMVEREERLASWMLPTVLSNKSLTPDQSTPGGYKLAPSDQTLYRLRSNPNIARSLVGGTPEANYLDFDHQNPRVELDTTYSSNRQGIDYPKPGQAKFFLRCGGADTPRPVTLARNNAGLWKVIEFSSLTLGVRPSAAVAGDF